MTSVVYKRRMVGRLATNELETMHLEGQGSYVIDVLSRHFPGGTKEYNYEPQAGKPVSQPRFERSTS
jgi:hypothetical protein